MGENIRQRCDARDGTLPVVGGDCGEFPSKAVVNSCEFCDHHFRLLFHGGSGCLLQAFGAAGLDVWSLS